MYEQEGKEGVRGMGCMSRRVRRGSGAWDV